MSDQMANRPRGYGFTAEIKNKIASKYDESMEQQARVWIESIIGEKISDVSDNEILGMDRFYNALKNGIFLCKVADAVCGKCKFNKMKMAFKEMENINNFLVACEAYGVAKTDLFQTVDLYENQNLWQVVCALHALGRKAQANGYQGPVLGPKESAKNVREFTSEQLTAGNAIIGLQMGTNKLASQKGMSFGNTRHIADIKVDDMSQDSQSTIGLQMGSNQGASQSGQNFGKPRGILGSDK